MRALVLTPLPPELQDLMGRYGAAQRYAYCHLVRGERALDIERVVAARYSLNSRYSKDAVHAAAALIAAQKELVRLRVREWAGKLQGAERKLARAASPLKRAGLQAKAEKRRRKLAFWERHQAAGTHPPVVFGGRKAFRDRCAGKISREEWRERRSGRLVSRGDYTKGGNLNLRLVPGGPGGAALHMALPGDGRLARRLVLPVYLPRKVSKRTGAVNGIDWRRLVLDYLSTGRAYKVELVRRDSRVHCLITVEEAVPAPAPARLHLGVDTNPTGMAAALVAGDGNLRQSWWLGDGELTSARRDRRRNRAGELAARLVALAREKEAALVIEDLAFADDREVGAKFHRWTHQFVYRRLLDAVERRAARAGVRLGKVHPAYTSAIGGLKYAHQYRLSIHRTAALVIARRGMGLQERVPVPLRPLVRNVDQLPEWKAWAALKRAVMSKLKAKGVKSLVSWPQHRRSVLGLAMQGA